MHLIDKLAWLLIKDKKLLVARSKNKLLFYLPGGKREPGESDQQALIREIKEEISVELAIESIQYAHTTEAPADGKDDGTKVKLGCYFADYYGDIAANSEIDELLFIDSQQRALCSAATIKVIDWLAQQQLIN